MLTFHLVAVSDYDADAATYTPRAYATDGFVHTSRTIDALAAAGNRYYRSDLRPYLILTIDLDLLQAPWRYDAAGDLFPHLYGPVNGDAIVATQRAVRATDGTFLPHLGDRVVGHVEHDKPATRD